MNFIAEREAEEVDGNLNEALKQKWKGARGPFCLNILSLTFSTLWMKEWSLTG